MAATEEGSNGGDTDTTAETGTGSNTAVLLPDIDTNFHITSLLKIVNIPKVKTELNRLKNNMGFSTQEDGKRFIYLGNDINNSQSYTDTNFSQQEPNKKKTNYLVFPPLQDNTLIGAHFHPALTDDSPIRYISKLPGGTDVAEHIKMVKRIAQTNPVTPPQINQITNFIVSKGASGKTYAIRTNNEQSIVDLEGDFERGSEEREKIENTLNGLS